MSVSPSAQLPRNARTPAVAGPASAERRRRASRELLAAGALAVPGLEARDPATGVHDALLAGVEGVAGRADLDVDHAVLLRAPRGELVAAAAGHLGLDVLGVDARLHGGWSSHLWPPGPLGVRRGEPEASLPPGILSGTPADPVNNPCCRGVPGARRARVRRRRSPGSVDQRP